jgi:hypothetical protein
MTCAVSKLQRSPLLTIVASALLSAAVQAQAQQTQQVTVHSRLPEPGRFKTSNGFLVQWNGNAKDPASDAIEAFDPNGERVLGVNLFKLLPSARAVSIDDVAARRDQPLAVAAVISEKDGSVRPVLLYVGWDGELVRAVDLDPSREIGWLEFDEAGNLWALTDYLGRKVWADTNAAGINCPLGPLILVFNREGQIARSLLKQADFPDGFQEGQAIGGRVSFGVTKETIWFWQPVRHRMFVVDREGLSAKRISASLPVSRSWFVRIAHIRNAAAPIEAGFSAFLPSGQLLANIISAEPDVPSGLYLSRRQRFQKSAVHSPGNTYLAGIDGSEFVFVSIPRPGSNDFQVIRETADAGGRP